MADELAIIGKIPGYNANIDAGGIFEKELLKGVTYIDLYPTAYVDAFQLYNTATDTGSGAANTSAGPKNIHPFGIDLKKLFVSPGLVQSIPSSASPKDPSSEMFKGILRKMQASFKLDESFSAKKGLRIIAANDSTFTETFTNSFDNENAFVSGYNNLKGNLQSKSLVSQALKGAKTLNSNAMYDLLGMMHKNAGNSGVTLQDLGMGAVLGMNVASPAVWSASQYNSTLTMFIKLVSPTGQADCIRKNILEPLMYLIAATSPITGYGVVYGFPLLWQVHAQGITNFRIGSVAAMSIIRGSFETTFTKALQPTVVDVRLTVIPLLSDFASQVESAASAKVPNIYDTDQAHFLGVQNPADINRGLMNTLPIGQTNKTAPIVSIRL